MHCFNFQFLFFARSKVDTNDIPGRGDGGGTPYCGLYGEAPPGGGILFQAGGIQKARDLLTGLEYRKNYILVSKGPLKLSRTDPPAGLFYSSEKFRKGKQSHHYSWFSCYFIKL